MAKRPTAGALAMRDPALASILGVVAGIGGMGATFGYERPARAADIGSDFGGDFGDDFIAGDFGLDYWGADAPAAAPMVKTKPNINNPLHAAKLAQLWDSHVNGMSKTARREAILEPNKGSATKVVGYEFPLGTTNLTIGTVTAISLQRNPTVKFRPKRFFSSTPAPGFAFLSQIQVSNVNAVVGGNVDSFNYSALAQNSMLNLPTIEPSLPASVSGRTTTLVPAGLVGGSTYEWGCSFQGPATVVGE